MEETRMNNSSSRQPKPKTSSLLSVLLTSLAVLVVLNLVASFFFYRMDFSKGKIHTLSKTSKNISRDLKDKLVVKAYFSRNLPPEYNLLARYTKDLLSEYKIYGKGKFRYELVTRQNEEDFKTEAQRNNIFPQPVMLLENDQQSIRKIFLGITFEYKGNHETLNLSKDMEGRLEYEITALIRRLVKAGLPSVSVYEDSLYSEKYYQYFEQGMKKNYNLLPVTLYEPVMASKVMVFPGVADSLTKIQLYNLDQYIMHGGKVIFLLDKVAGVVQMNQATEIHSNIFNLLEHYGVQIKPNLVMDQNCASINLSQRSGIFVVDVPMPFPPIPRLQGMQNQIISRNLSDIFVYLCSEINPKPLNKGITISPLLQSSKNSGELSGPQFDISPEKFMNPKLMPSLIMPPKTVAALVTGTFTSYYAKDPAVQDTKGFISRNPKGEVIVVSDADLIRDFVAANTDANLLFVFNAIDFLMGDTSMVEVRSRIIPNSILDVNYWLQKNHITPERAAEVEPAVKLVIKGINILLASLLLILYGVIRFFWMKQRNRYIQEMYSTNASQPHPPISDQEQP